MSTPPDGAPGDEDALDAAIRASAHRAVLATPMLTAAQVGAALCFPDVVLDDAAEVLRARGVLPGLPHSHGHGRLYPAFQVDWAAQRLHAVPERAPRRPGPRGPPPER